MNAYLMALRSCQSECSWARKVLLMGWFQQWCELRNIATNDDPARAFEPGMGFEAIAFFFSHADEELTGKSRPTQQGLCRNRLHETIGPPRHEARRNSDRFGDSGYSSLVIVTGGSVPVVIRLKPIEQ